MQVMTVLAQRVERTSNALLQHQHPHR